MATDANGSSVFGAVARLADLSIADSASAKEFGELVAAVVAADDQKAAAGAVADKAKAAGAPKAFKDGCLLQHVLKVAGEDKTKEGKGRAAAMRTLEALVALGKPAEPYLVKALGRALEVMGDKSKDAKEAATDFGTALFAVLSPNATAIVVPVLIKSGMDEQAVPGSKVAALVLLKTLVGRAGAQVAACMADCVSACTSMIGDIKKDVKEQALDTMAAVCTVVGNRDIEKFIPDVIDCIANPANTPECIHKLSATTFAQTVEAPCLSLLCPLLLRGLREPVTAIKRKTCVVIENMSKLVENPADVAPFLGLLVPEVESVSVNVADPECRSVAKRGKEYLLMAGQVMSADEAEVPVSADPAVVGAALKEEIGKAGHKGAVDEDMLTYVAAQCASLIARRSFAAAQWQGVITEYLGTPAAVATAFMERCYKEAADKEKNEEEEEDGEDLCDCEFSLAYGGKILLNNARLHLKTGKRYGLCGPNGAGKSTLMRAIANGQIEGFPTADQLRCIYVEHDIDGSNADTPAVDFVAENELLQKMGVTRDDVEKMLTSVGFTEELRNKPVGSLSGGWKMKLALSRAMLQKADILLLDEPTNHLDVANVKWLMDYLIGLERVTSVLVSHDSGFLDTVCTDILHYEKNLKLKKYRGNLSAFVKLRPEAKSYYELQATQIKFTFPEPTYLEGVNSKGKAIIKVTNMSFQYPNTPKPQLTGVSVQCSLSSRVGVIGPNGAGKSTMIKVLCGETSATEGHVWRHPNMRIAYVAQHAFHHLEKHLDMTPNEYIRWRYASGEDREAAGRVDRKLTDEEKKKMAEAMNFGGVKRVIDKLVTRRKGKKGYEYEVQWKNSSPEDNMWIQRDQLVETGFEKMVNEFDAKEAAAQGMLARPLTLGNVEKHLGALGLEAEFATHNRVRGLSGGQKVKVVLAAATWNNPHILILDEPTNYLDRESLGALSQAINEFGGGVVIISHNQEFIDSICSEKWFVNDGTCRVEGQQWTAEKVADKKPTEVTDAWGNTVKVKADKKKLSRKELKALKKKREAARARGEEVSDSDDDWE
ncbi:unnamed protein product [Pedinophyceae sp. YPF-701]|nr:unnamed protein product [Pedinophyceae sp. YPF-701]